MELEYVWSKNLLDYVITNQVSRDNFKTFMLGHFPTRTEFVQNGDKIKSQLYPALDCFEAKDIPKGQDYDIWKTTNEFKNKINKTEEEKQMMGLRVKLSRQINKWYDEIGDVIYSNGSGKKPSTSKKNPVDAKKPPKSYMEFNIKEGILKVKDTMEKSYTKDGKLLAKMPSGNWDVMKQKHARNELLIHEILKLCDKYKKEDEVKGTNEALKTQEIIDFIDSQDDEEMEVSLGRGVLFGDEEAEANNGMGDLNDAGEVGQEDKSYCDDYDDYDEEGNPKETY